MKFKPDKFNKLLSIEPESHGTPPPSDAECARTHPTGCMCPGCFDHYQQPPTTEDNNKLWRNSIINENN